LDGVRAEPVPVQVAVVSRGTVEQTVTEFPARTVKARRRAKLSPQEGWTRRRAAEARGRSREGGRRTACAARLVVVAQARPRLARREYDAAVADEKRGLFRAERASREQRPQSSPGPRRDRLHRPSDQMDSAARTAGGVRIARRAAGQARTGVDRARGPTARLHDAPAPFDGVIAELQIEVGEWSTPSPPVIQVPSVIDVIDTSSIYVSAPMDEVDSARLKPGQPARVAVDAYPNKRFRDASSAWASTCSTSRSRTAPSRSRWSSTTRVFAATLLPGTSADVEVILDTHENVLRMPSAALLSGDKVLRLDGRTLDERPVQVGLKNWDVTEITSGLTEGDRVVTSLDRSEVKAGARVTVNP
jgi:HlyD family secretion protein